MRIRKKETSIGILGKIINSFSSSKQDTYSCDFINQLKESVDSDINEVNNKLTAVGDSRFLVSFNTEQIETKNIEDYTQYRFLYFAISGFGQCLSSAIVPIDVFTDMGLETNSGGGFSIGSADYGGHIYRIRGTSTQLAGKVDNTLYPIYVYGIK